MLAFIGGVLVIGSKTVPKFINFVGRTNQHDILIVSLLELYLAFRLLPMILVFLLLLVHSLPGVLNRRIKSTFCYKSASHTHKGHVCGFLRYLLSEL